MENNIMTTLLKTSVSAAVLATFLAGSPVSAADLGNNGGSTPVDYQAPISWTGFYLGGRIGYGNANHELSLSEYFKSYCGDVGETHGFEDGYHDISNRDKYLVDGTLVCPADKGGGDHDSVVVDGDSREVANLNGLNSSGLTGGAQIGFDKQIGTRFVVGVFGSYDLSAMDTTASLGPIDLTLIEKGDEWSVGARAGFLLHPRVLAYVLAAYTEADWTFGDGILGKKEVTFSGVTAGAGLEYAVSENVFVGIEGTHTFYGKETILDAYDAEDNSGFRLDDEIGETKVLGTLKVKLNSDNIGLGF